MFWDYFLKGNKPNMWSSCLSWCLCAYGGGLLHILMHSIDYSYLRYTVYTIVLLLKIIYQIFVKKMLLFLIFLSIGYSGRLVLSVQGRSHDGNKPNNPLETSRRNWRLKLLDYPNIGIGILLFLKEV